MRHRSPHKAGSAGAVGNRPPESSETPGHDDLHAEIRGRANAILAELQAEAPDWETISELALGAHERIDAAT